MSLAYQVLTFLGWTCLACGLFETNLLQLNFEFQLIRSLSQATCGLGRAFCFLSEAWQFPLFAGSDLVVARFSCFSAFSLVLLLFSFLFLLSSYPRLPGRPSLKKLSLLILFGLKTSAIGISQSNKYSSTQPHCISPPVF